MKETEAVRKAVDQARREGRLTEGPAAKLPGVEPEEEKSLSEKEFHWKVVGLAEQCGWRVYHVYFSENSAAGFPDLICLREDRQVVIECKVGKNKPTKAQADWLDAYRRLPNTTVMVAYPKDWPEIERVLA